MRPLLALSASCVLGSLTAFGCKSANTDQMKHSTAGQAIQAAAVFCSAIGQPVTATASAVFPEPMVAANPDRPPCWEVSFPGQATVDVCDGTLVIRNYIDFADGCLDGPPGRPEPIANALKTFTVVVTASGQRNLELAPPRHRTADQSILKN